MRGDRGVRVSPDIKDTEWAYIAGIVDGEGTIRNDQNQTGRHYPRVSVVQNDPEMLYFLKAKLDGSVEIHQSAGYKLGKTGYLSTKDTWRWNTSGENARFILEKLMPYLIVKKAKAQVVLEKVWR